MAVRLGLIVALLGLASPLQAQVLPWVARPVVADYPDGTSAVGWRAVPWEDALRTGEVTGTRSLIALVVTFMDRDHSGPLGATVASVRGQLLTDARNVAQFYADVSGGRWQFGTVAVDGPVRVPYAAAGACVPQDWADAADAAALGLGVDVGAYQHRMYVLPHWVYLPSCRWAGLSDIGCDPTCRTWIAERPTTVMTHELGHHLGLDHAGTDPDNDGLGYQYADTMDVMSSTRDWRRFGGAFTAVLGWTAAPVFAITTPGRTRITLAALGSGQGTEVVTVPRRRANDWAYYVSLREATGYDAGMTPTGVTVQHYSTTPRQEGGAGSYLARHSYWLATLADGETWEDGEVRVTQVARTTGAAVVEVEYLDWPAPYRVRVE